MIHSCTSMQNTTKLIARVISNNLFSWRNCAGTENRECGQKLHLKNCHCRDNSICSCVVIIINSEMISTI